MSQGISPTLPTFLPKLNILLHCLSQKGFKLDQFNLHPLVCEIEADLPNVIDKFAKGNSGYFHQSVIANATASTVTLKNIYPYLNIEGGTFSSGMSQLSAAREYMEGYVEFLIERNRFPKVFLSKLESIAQDRKFMFENLYGAKTPQEKYAIALRQMVNYLAVDLALAYEFPEGCVVLNNMTPNLEYVKQPEKFMREFFQLDPIIELPLFHFF